MRRLFMTLACVLLSGTTHAQRYYYSTCPNGQCPPQQVWYYYRTQVQTQRPQVQIQRPQVQTQAQPPVQQAVYTTQTTTTAAGDYGFTAWLNSVRASRGLGFVGWSQAMAYDAAVNSSYGFAHSYMGRARRQNVGAGAAATVWSMWLGHGPHAAALLDPSITAVGIAYVNGIWTYSAY